MGHGSSTPANDRLQKLKKEHEDKQLEDEQLEDKQLEPPMDLFI